MKIRYTIGWSRLYDKSLSTGMRGGAVEKTIMRTLFHCNTFLMWSAVIRYMRRDYSMLAVRRFTDAYFIEVWEGARPVRDTNIGKLQTSFDILTKRLHERAGRKLWK